MKILDFASVKLSICLILGILYGTYFQLSITIALTITILCICTLGMLWQAIKSKSSIYFGLCAGITTIAIGALSFTISQPKNWNTHYTNTNKIDEKVWHLKITEVLKPNNFSKRYFAKIMSSNTTGEIVLNVVRDSNTNSFNVDDEIIGYKKLSAIKAPLNLHQFNHKNYLENLGVYHQINLTSDEFVSVKKSPSTIYGFVAKIRNHIITKLKKAKFGKEELAIVQALLLGQRNDISKATYNNYKNAGAVHILALSGLHIGILLLLLEYLLKPLTLLPKGNTIRLITITVLLWSFALLAGFSASIIRAVTMFSFLAYARYLNRPSNTFNVLALSLFFTLLFNPKLLYQVGFQMSYAAVFAIVWIHPLLQNLWSPKHLILRKTWQLLSVSTAAQLGVLPISLFYFHQFPSLFFISNLIIVPFLGILLGLGIGIIILATLNILPEQLVLAYNYAIKTMNTAVAVISEQERFIFKNIAFDHVQLILSYSIIVLLIVSLQKKTFKTVILLLLCVLGFQFWLIYSDYQAKEKDIVIIAHQNKNSVLLHQSNGRLFIHTTDKKQNSNFIQNYQIAERVSSLKFLKLKNSYSINTNNLQIIDSIGIYANKNGVLLLTQSPKINLDQLIDSINPQTIIADGSNYTSYVDRWKATCLKRKLPFHYTGEKGAYYFNLINKSSD